MGKNSINERAMAVAPSRTSIPVNGGLPLPLAIRRFGWLVAILAVLFCVPLFQLASLVLQDEFYSHVPLIPLVSFYLIWQIRHRLPRMVSSAPGEALIFAGCGLGALTALGWLLFQRTPMPASDSLALSIGALFCFLLAGAFQCFGREMIRLVAFPVGFLIFFVPFPSFVISALEVFFQHTSAEAAHLLILVSGTPILRDGLIFRLTGIVIEVGTECSGIRSSLVLFITSLLAGHLFLRNRASQLGLALAVIALGILRNGFRIFILEMLCVHVDSAWINSPLHHNGGPIFFALSLIPLFLLLLLLIKWEQRGKKS